MIKKVSEIGEQNLIEKISEIIRQLSSEFPQTEKKKSNDSTVRSEGKLILGIGDDAAVWQPPDTKALTLTTDTAIEGVHFPPLQKLNEKEIELCGSRASTANLSDLAAMAALPAFALINLTLPPELPLNHFNTLFRGIAKQLLKFNAEIIGGNLSSAPSPINITITVGGTINPGEIPTRRGAKEGDLIGITGYPGSSAAGLIALQSIKNPALEYPELLSAYFQPTPRIKEALLLAPHLNSLTDISDGLLLDLKNIATPSKKGALLYWETIPKRQQLTKLAKQLSIPLENLVLSASDDYELLFTAPKKNRSKIEYIAQKNSIPLHWIGEIILQPDLLLVKENKTKKINRPNGWDHFRM